MEKARLAARSRKNAGAAKWWHWMHPRGHVQFSQSKILMPIVVEVIVAAAKWCPSVQSEPTGAKV